MTTIQQAIELLESELAGLDEQAGRVRRALDALREVQPAAPVAKPARVPLRAAVLSGPAVTVQAQRQEPVVALDAPAPARPAANASPPERIERLRSLVASGLSRKAIAEQLGVTGSRVLQLMKANGIEWPADHKPAQTGGRPRIDREAVRTLHAEGLNDGQIAERIGASGVGVLGVRRELGLPAHGRGGSVTESIPAAGRPAFVEINSTRTLIDFLRGRDADVKDLGKGKFKLGPREIDTDGLLARANAERERMKQPPFKWREGLRP